jgi:hypothetical protein
MTEYLYDVVFERVDRVRNPANPKARIVLAKASDLPEGADMATDEGVTDDANNEPRVLNLDDAEAVAAFVAQWRAENDTDDDPKVDLSDEAIAAAVAEMTDEQLAAVAKAADGRLAVADAADEDPIERIAKSGALDDEAVALLRKQADEARANALRIEKMESERRLERFVKSAATDMPSLTESAEDLGRLLADVAAAVADDEHKLVKSLQRVLKAASAQAAEAMDILAKSQGAAGERQFSKADDELNRLAKERAAAEGIPFHQAKLRVAAANSDLVARHFGGDAS